MRVFPLAETYTHDGLLSLLDRLSVPGTAAPWFRQFAPIWMEGAIPGTAASEPRLHVGAACARRVAASTVTTSPTGCRPAP